MLRRSPSCTGQSEPCAFLASLAQDSQSSVGSPLSRVGTQIIGAEDDDFDTEQEQVGMDFFFLFLAFFLQHPEFSSPVSAHFC